MDSYLRPVADINPTQPTTTTVLTFCKSTTRNQRFIYLPLINPKTLVPTSILCPRANQCPYILSRLVAIVTGILYLNNSFLTVIILSNNKGKVHSASTSFLRSIAAVFTATCRSPHASSAQQSTGCALRLQYRSSTSTQMQRTFNQSKKSGKRMHSCSRSRCRESSSTGSKPDSNSESHYG